MLAEVSPSAEKVWLGSDDEDLQKLLRDLQQVHLPDHPRQAWARLQILNHIKYCINAIELDHIKVLKQIEKGDPYGVDNAADWLAQSMHLRPNAAYAKVCTACELEEFPNLYRRVHEGELSPRRPPSSSRPCDGSAATSPPSTSTPWSGRCCTRPRRWTTRSCEPMAPGSSTSSTGKLTPGSPRNGACGVRGVARSSTRSGNAASSTSSGASTAGSPAAVSWTRRAAPSCRSHSKPSPRRTSAPSPPTTTAPPARPCRRAGGACRAPAGVW